MPRAPAERYGLGRNLVTVRLRRPRHRVAEAVSALRRRAGAASPPRHTFVNAARKLTPGGAVQPNGDDPIGLTYGGARGGSERRVARSIDHGQSAPILPGRVVVFAAAGILVAQCIIG